MGYFGTKSYESDWIQDLLNHFGLDFISQPNHEKLGSILHWIEKKVNTPTEYKEAFLGIICFLINNHKANSVLIGVQNLQKALIYADDLLNDEKYSSKWGEIWEERAEQINIERISISNLLQ